jgi:hypothetical protein
MSTYDAKANEQLQLPDGDCSYYVLKSNALHELPLEAVAYADL